LIGKYEADLNETKELPEITQSTTDNDVIQNVLEYLNTPNAPLKMTSDQGEHLADLTQSYLVHVQADAAKIADQQQKLA
jgi:hypothetical protein